MYKTMMNEMNASAAKHFNERAIEHEQQANEKLKRSGIFITSGDGVKLWVRKGMLALKHGSTHIPRDEKETILNKGVHRTERIYIVSETGYVTFDALNWCVKQHIAVIILSKKGELLLTNSVPYTDVKLCRSQYYAADTALEGFINRTLIQKKTLAQLYTIQRLPQQTLFFGKRYIPINTQPASKALKELEKGLDALANATTKREIMLIEASLAHLYWKVYDGRMLQWDEKALKVIPDHWKVISERPSGQSSGTPRQATNPFHAALNYSYSMLEAQIRQGIYRSGLDPTCGFLHSDKVGRDSLVFDLMEPFRAKIDLLVFLFLTKLTLKLGDCLEGEKGECRLNPQLTRLLLASCQIEQSQIDAEVQWVVDLLVPVQ
jgi:CRISPR-associated protein Cas1